MANLWNSSELNCGPLSDTKMSGTPYRNAEGGKLANILHLDIVAIIVNHHKQCAALQLTEVSTHLRPWPCCKLMLLNWLLALLRLVSHADVTLRDIVFQLCGHARPVHDVTGTS